ncbi:MAG: hypothetical protein HQL91_10725 [Magnetococcales bacterium]|nr:hypothetical protein [Magnetococcales bacterium]
MTMRKSWIDPLLFAGLAGLPGIFLFLRALPEEQLREWLVRWTGPFLGINATLMLLSGLLELSTITVLARRFLPGRLILLLPAFLVGGTLYTALLAPQTHRIYYDETIYLSIGQNLAQLNRAQTCHSGGETHGRFLCDFGEYNKQPNGYPFLVSLIFRLFGTSERAAFYFNNLLLGMAAMVAMLLVLPAGGTWRAGMFAAWVVVLNPQNLHWFNTTAAEPAAALTAALAVLAAFHYRRRPAVISFVLLTALTAFAVQFRPESLLLLPLIGVIVLPTAWQRPRLLVANLLLLLLLTLPLWLHVALFHAHPWGSSGKPFGLEYLADNLYVNGWHYLDNQLFPLPFTLLALFGLFRFGPRLRERWMIAGWMLLFWGVFLFFYAGSYRYGADIRYALLSALPLAILAGLGAEALFKRLIVLASASTATGTALLIALLWCAHLPFMPLARATTDEAWGARADIHYARRMVRELPPESLVLTHNPNYFQLWGVHAAQLSVAETDPNHLKQVLFPRYPGGIYMHHNFWCNVPDPVQNRFCTTVHTRFNTTIVSEFREKSYRYALYRLQPK